MTAPFHESTIQVPSGGVFGESQSGASGAIGSNLYGTGTPEGVIAAKIGTVYRDVTPAAAKIYVKTSGTSTTGWEAIGGTSGTSVTHVKTTIGHATSGLLTGVTIYTPAVGEQLIDAWPEITVAWNGTTPNTDIALQAGFTATALAAEGAGSGLYGCFGSGPIDLSVADVTDGSLKPLVPAWAGFAMQGPGSGTTQWGGLANAISASGVIPWRPPTFVSTAPLLAVVSTDGTQQGSAVGGTTGTLIWHLLIIPA